MEKKIIAFDIDRTLVDSFAAEIQALKDALNIVLRKEINEDVLAESAHLPTKDFYKKINLTEDEIKKVDAEWSEASTKYQIVFFPGIVEAIKKLYKEGYCLNIITSRTKEELQELDHLLDEVKGIFEVIVTSDLVKKPKPSKDSLDYLCKKTKCTSKDIIYIGDSKSDEKFAQNSGCYFIPITWENKELIDSSNTCNTIDEMLDTIYKISKQSF